MRALILIAHPTWQNNCLLPTLIITTCRIYSYSFLVPAAARASYNCLAQYAPLISYHVLNPKTYLSLMSHHQPLAHLHAHSSYSYPLQAHSPLLLPADLSLCSLCGSQGSHQGDCPPNEFISYRKKKKGLAPASTYSSTALFCVALLRLRPRLIGIECL
jgi:hypothetical protein